MALNFLDPTIVEPPEHDALQSTSARTLALNVRMPDGGRLSLFTAAGISVGEALKQFGIPIRRTKGCDGSSGSSPSARLELPWRLGADDDGTRVLSDLTMTPDLDGVALELPWDAIELETSWVAG